ncbi:MAG: hypothetical protein ACJAZ1_003300 [Yoonia sp.]|jgi:hypothetical protein
MPAGDFNLVHVLTHTPQRLGKIGMLLKGQGRTRSHRLR